MQIKLPKRLFSGNPNPRLPCNYLLSKGVPEYSLEEIKSYSDLGAQESCNRWWVLPDGRTCLPKLLDQNWLTALHHAMHCDLRRSQNSFPLCSCLAIWTPRKPSEHFRPQPGLCPGKGKEGHASPRPTESRYSTWWILGNGLHWNQDRTVWLQISAVFVYSTTDWVKAFLSHTEMAQVLAKKLIMEIICRFGLPISLGSTMACPWQPSYPNCSLRLLT